MSKKNKNILDKLLKKEEKKWDNKKIPNKLNKNPNQPIIILLLVSLVISAWYTIFWDSVLENYNKAPAKEVSLSEMQFKYNAWELEEIKINNTKINRFKWNLP